jgi:hypothetical protein
MGIHRDGYPMSQLLTPVDNRTAKLLILRVKF